MSFSLPLSCAVLLHFYVNLEANGEDEEEEEEEEDGTEVSPEQGNYQPPSSTVLDVDLKWFNTNTPAAPNTPASQ